ncbi:MAG: stage V sporulation protein SpoVM [Butyricicoccus sp.]
MIAVKIVVIKSPRLLAGLLRGIFHMKKAESIG